MSVLRIETVAPNRALVKLPRGLAIATPKYCGVTLDLPSVLARTRFRDLIPRVFPAATCSCSAVWTAWTVRRVDEPKKLEVEMSLRRNSEKAVQASTA